MKERMSVVRIIINDIINLLNYEKFIQNKRICIRDQKFLISKNVNLHKEFIHHSQKSLTF